jgi:hypothetical protein
VFNFPEGVFSTVRVCILNNKQSELTLTHESLVRHLRQDGNLHILSQPREGVPTVVPDDHPNPAFPPIQIKFTDFQNEYRGQFHRGQALQDVYFKQAVRSTQSRFCRKPVIKNYAPLIPGVPTVYFFPRIDPRCPPCPATDESAFNVLQYPHPSMDTVVIPHNFLEYLEITNQKLVLNGIHQFDLEDVQVKTPTTGSCEFTVCSFRDFHEEVTGQQPQRRESMFNFDTAVRKLAFYDQLQKKTNGA